MVDFSKWKSDFYKHVSYDQSWENREGIAQKCRPTRTSRLENKWMAPGREVQVCTAQVIPLPNLSGTPDTGTSELKMPLNFSKFICKISVDILILEAQDPRFFILQQFPTRLLYIYNGTMVNLNVKRRIKGFYILKIIPICKMWCAILAFDIQS